MSDAIVVAENWISEHYFSSEGKESFATRVKDQRKFWDSEAKAGAETVRSTFTGARQELISLLAELSDTEDPAHKDLAVSERFYDRLLAALGYNRPGLELEQSGPLTRVRTIGIAGPAPLAIVRARPVEDVTELLSKHEATLAAPFLPSDDEEPITSAARLLSLLFTDSDAPEFALVLSGSTALVADQKSWAEGRYLTVDVQLILDRNDTKKGGEIDRALRCISADSLAPDADGAIWWTSVLKDSVNHTVGVSKDLRDGVRESIEIIAGEVVARRAAKGLDPLPQAEAQDLAIQSLRFLYRILFLLYAEASPELGVLPTGAAAYERGYSLDRLRDLALVELDEPRSQNGTHLYQSLSVLFRLVDQGHQPPQVELATTEGLRFDGLRADLFAPVATALIDQVGLGNQALQQVLQRLLVSKKSAKADRGFISYAELGINQLGAVYEGLMSYTGFFATEDLYEVAPGGDDTKGSWVVPVERARGINEADFVRFEDPITGEKKPVLHERGSFVFRLAGRDRQQSASYYTPEVLTQFTVGQALEELLDQDGETTPARDILNLTVCEPALGSGAFAIEATRQLAQAYLSRREEELGQRVDPEDYPRELQKVKTYIALHNVYGVDLNATAVELAEISLWLDTMGPGLAAPWFGLHLRRGNSLIGARRATYRADQVADKTYLKSVPRHVSFDEDPGGSIHHFLLPAEGWGASVGAKEGKNLAPEKVKVLRAWQRSVRAKLSKQQIKRLGVLARRVERLWGFARQRLTIAEAQIRRSVDVWGAADLPEGGSVTREQIEESLANPAGAFQRLKTVMDAWNALWFWPLTDRFVDGAASPEPITPPSVDQWLGALEGLLGSAVEESSSGRGERWRGGDATLASGADWVELGVAEEIDLGLAGAQSPAAVLQEHPWLEVCAEVAAEQGFFHWELFFAPVFADRGGFDLQVGNPPWVRPRSDVDALLAEGDPWFQLAIKPTQAQVRERREATLLLPGVHDLVLDGTAEVASTAEYVGEQTNYPSLAGLQPDLYRCFMEQTWRHRSAAGAVGLIHPETHFTDEKAGLLRGEAYRRLRRHWHFLNERILFEIDDKRHFGIHIYQGAVSAPSFLQATYLYDPATVLQSLAHSGDGVEPGLKDENTGTWDLRPHRNRIIHVDREVLASWHALLEDDSVPIEQTRMVYTVNRASALALEKIAAAPRVGELGPKFSRGWDESIDRRKGRFETEWGRVDSWQDAILQGPHLHVGTPFFKAPNATMRNNQDWADVDLEALAPDALPITAYKPAGDRAIYDASYTDWGEDGTRDPARNHYRLAWRAMAANTGERTLIPALIPPGAAHINGVFAVGVPQEQKVRTDNATVLLGIAGFASSLIADFSVRAAPKSGIYQGVFERLPFVADSELMPSVVLRVLRLNCLTSAYSDLWDAAWEEYASTDPSQPHPFTQGKWTGGMNHPDRPALGEVGPTWTPDVPLRRDSDRRQALIEIDALVALSLGITADELVTIYRTQFPVLYGYDHGKYLYDANGRLVPTSIQQTWRKRSDKITEEERTQTHPGSGVTYTYELPFTHLDREADLRSAISAFSQRCEAEPAARAGGIPAT